MKQQQYKIVVRSSKPSGYKVTLYKKMFVFFWMEINSWEDIIPFSFKTRKATILYKIPDKRVIFKFKNDQLFV